MKNFVVGGILALSAVAFGAPPTGRYKVALDVLQQLQQGSPKYSSLVSFGPNDEGVDIIGLRVSTTPQQTDVRKVGHLVVATHHGNELRATDFALAFAQRLLQRYGSRELYSSSLADIEWLIIPVLNVSGYNANNRHEHGYDSNRDYPGPCINQAGGKVKSIQMMMNLLRSRPFAAAATIHGYIGTVTFPWGVNTTNTRTLDHNAYERMFAKAASYNGYRYGTSTDLIYSAEGTFEDYVYWRHGIWSLLLELKDGSKNDIRDSVLGVEAFFNEVDSSPSTKNQMTGSCKRGAPDLRLE